LISIDPALLFVQAVTFGLAVLLLWRLFWKPLTRFMRRRSDRIEHDIEAAEQARAEARRLELDLRRRLDRVEEEAKALLGRAAEESRAAREKLLADAHEEARRLIEDAGRQASAERERAARELRADTVALAMLIAEKALQQSVDPAVQQRLVREFVTELADDN
jgi:F-type H+-transporting ATPase subunit b